MMAVLGLFAILLPIAVLIIARRDIFDSHKKNPVVWCMFYLSVIVIFFTLDTITNVVAIIAVVSATVLIFAYLLVRVIIKKRQYLLHDVNDGETFFTRHHKLASGKVVLPDLALWIIQDYENVVLEGANSAREEKLVSDLLGNKHTPASVLNYALTVNLPEGVLCSLAENISLSPNALTALALRADVSPKVLDAILNNKNIETSTVRVIIGMLDDPYSLIEGSSPQQAVADKAIALLKERKPELKDIENKYIIASCSPVF